MDNKDFDWFAFYPNKFDRGTNEMDAHLVGIYLRLLIQEWFKGSISSDLRGMDDTIEVTGEILEIINSSSPTTSSASSTGNSQASTQLGSQTQNFYGTNQNSKIRIRMNRAAIWEALKGKFFQTEDGRWKNEKLEYERKQTEKRIDTHRIAQEKGAKGGRAKAEKYGLGSSSATSPTSSPSTSPTTSSVSSPTNSIGTTQAVAQLLPITVQYISILLKKEGLSKNEKLVEKICRALTDWEQLPGTEILQKASPDFAKFAVEHWVVDVAQNYDNMSEAKMRKNFIDFIRIRYADLEKAFTLADHDEKWFLAELQRAANDYGVINEDLEGIGGFRKHYLKKKESGRLYFQTLSNFQMDREFKAWMDKDRQKRERKNRVPVKKGSVVIHQPSAPPKPEVPKPQAPSTEQQDAYDRDIKGDLNNIFRGYVTNGSLSIRFSTSLVYDQLKEYVADLPDRQEIEDTIGKEVYEERKAMANANNLGDLIHQYTKGQLSTAERMHNQEETFARAIKQFFDRMKGKQDLLFSDV